MGKVYIGVTAVGGHKLWGVVEGAGCGVRWFGGMGERWKIDGRRRGGCGPGTPGPYRVMERGGRGDFSHYNKRGEAGLSSTYLYSLLFMVHPVVFLIGRFAGQVHAEFL